MTKKMQRLFDACQMFKYSKQRSKYLIYHVCENQITQESFYIVTFMFLRLVVRYHASFFGIAFISLIKTQPTKQSIKPIRR